MAKKDKPEVRKAFNPSKLTTDIKELDGVYLGGYGLVIENLREYAGEIFKEISEIQLIGSDLYGDYGKVLIKGEGKTLVILACEEYFTGYVFDEV